MLIETATIFFLSLLLIAGIRRVAPKIGLLDIPNARSAHTRAVARGAGVGFVAAALLGIVLFHYDLLMAHGWTFLAILMILVVGFLDDHKDTSPNTKFFVIALAVCLLYLDGIVIDDIGTFFGYPVQFGWLALPFTIVAVVGFTNALNLVDGLDGLAAGISLVIFSTLFAVGYSHGDLFIQSVSLSFMAALVAFLLFNWNPASIFMGDSGSLVLGFVIALLSIKALAYLPAVSIFFLAAIPNMDLLIVFFRRKLHHRPVFQADKCHFHHILYHFFEENTKKTVLFLVILQLIYSMTGFQLDKQIDEGWLLILFVLNVIMLYLGLSEMIRRQGSGC
jgi:UDP-GlcNAc:undecaprenyl-phosphate GlcNAc-1-phosphate transferase